LRLYFVVARRAKLNISWLIIQFSLLVPFSLSILIYRETLELQGILGVALIFSSIVFFALGKGSSGQVSAIPDARTWVLLALSSLFSGMGMSVPRIYIALSPAGGAFTLGFYPVVPAVQGAGSAFGGDRFGDRLGRNGFSVCCSYLIVGVLYW